MKREHKHERNERKRERERELRMRKNILARWRKRREGGDERLILQMENQVTNIDEDMRVFFKV